MKKIIFRILGWFVRRARRPSLDGVRFKNILIIKLCCIGDVLFSTPLLRALRVAYPHARITYLISPQCRELVSYDPRVSGMIDYDPYTATTYWQKVTRAWKAIRTIRAQRFDLALVLHRSAGAALLPALAGVPARVGFDWQGGGFSLTHPVAYRPEAHEVDRYLDCLGPLHVDAAGTEMELPLPPAAVKYAADFLKQQGWLPDAGPLIAVFPGGGVNPGTSMHTKRWTAAGYQALCQALVKRYQAQLLFIGNAGDAAISDQVLGKQNWIPPVLRAEGKLNLLQSAALLRSCALFIGNDSGPLHMAAAVGVPTVAIYGPTDPKLLAPRGPRHRAVRQPLDCSPCYTPQTVHAADVTVCRYGAPLCMQVLPAEVVLRAADELLNQKGKTD